MPRRTPLPYRQAATRVAMFFEAMFPHARPGFEKRKDPYILRISYEEFRRIVDREKYEEAFHNRLCDELWLFSLLLMKVPADEGYPAYFLLISWQDGNAAKPSSYKEQIDNLLAKTRRWTEADYDAEWDKPWP